MSDKIFLLCWSIFAILVVAGAARWFIKFDLHKDVEDDN